MPAVSGNTKVEVLLPVGMQGLKVARIGAHFVVVGVSSGTEERKADARMKRMKATGNRGRGRGRGYGNAIAAMPLPATPLLVFVGDVITSISGNECLSLISLSFSRSFISLLSLFSEPPPPLP